MSKKKIAIVFFGLTRSIQETLSFIQINLFNEITACGLEYDIFLHTYKINGCYKNHWSGENIENYNNDLYKLLKAKYLIVDNQDDIEKSIDFSSYHSNLGNWFNMSNDQNFIKYLIRNMILALYSKNKITNILQEHKDEYDFAIIMRPDLKILNKINILQFINISNNTNIIIPRQDSHHGCNDRFCFTTVSNAIYYGTLYTSLLNYSRHSSICSEKFMLDMLNFKKLKIIYRPDIIYQTIRATILNQREPNNLKLSIDLNKNKVFYGYENNWFDITEKCKLVLKIPAGNNNKDIIFGDPYYLIPKKIMIKNIETSIQNVYNDNFNIFFE